MTEVYTRTEATPDDCVTQVLKITPENEVFVTFTESNITIRYGVGEDIARWSRWYAERHNLERGE